MATIRETILSYPALEDCGSYLDNIVLLKRGLCGSGECTAGNLKPVMLCAADLYAMAVNFTDFSEGKLSVSHSRGWYVQTAKRLYTEGGEPQNAFKVGEKRIQTGRAGNRW